MVKLKRSPSSSPPPTPQKRSRRDGRSSAWDPREDAIILAEHRKHPPTPWADVSDLVTALGLHPRTAVACRLRWGKHLQHEDPSAEPLSTAAKKLLKRAVVEVETGKEKWWCVAARFAELSKGGAEARVLGKGACKKWSEVLKGKGEWEGIEGEGE